MKNLTDFLKVVLTLTLIFFGIIIITALVIIAVFGHNVEIPVWLQNVMLWDIIVMTTVGLTLGVILLIKNYKQLK